MNMPQNPRNRPGDRDHLLHDVDLVAAYAGEDSGIDREAAAALVATCPDCRSEFALQRQVATWMSAAPAVMMDDAERSLLHDRVGLAFGQPTVVSLAERRNRRQPGQILFRIASAAAAVAVIAGLGGVFGNVGGDNDGGDAFQTISSELAVGEAAATTVPAETTTTAAAFAAGSVERAMLAGGDAEVVQREIEELKAQADDAASGGAPEDSQADAVTGIAPCADEVEDREVLLSAESVLDGEPIIVFIVAAETEDSAGSDSTTPEALIYTISDCSIVDLG